MGIHCCDFVHLSGRSRGISLTWCRCLVMFAKFRLGRVRGCDRGLNAASAVHPGRIWVATVGAVMIVRVIPGSCLNAFRREICYYLRNSLRPCTLRGAKPRGTYQLLIKGFWIGGGVFLHPPATRTMRCNLGRDVGSRFSWGFSSRLF